MKVALKIWRYDSRTGERALRDYEVDAPDWATLLDVLDIVKDRHDGTLAYRKSCRMMICGSCGMRMDGAAARAGYTRMDDGAHYGKAAASLRTPHEATSEERTTQLQPLKQIVYHLQREKKQTKIS